MLNPLFTKKHLREYLRWGLVAALAYISTIIFFLFSRRFENLYLVYIGNFLFMFVCGMYTFSLIDRPYEGKRAVSMLIAGHSTILAGVVISCLLVITAVLISAPGIFSSVPTQQLLENAPGAVQIHHSGELVLMILANTILVNAGGGSLMVVLFSYAAKRNQTTDKPVSLENRVSTLKK